MIEIRSRVWLAGLVAVLVGVALINMVVDRRSLADGGREYSWWSGLVLDVAVPVQKMVALPFEFTRNTWQEYLSLVEVGRENEDLRTRLAAAEEENLQLREALVAGGRLQRIAEMRDEFEVPMLPTELVGLDASSWFRSALLDRGRSDGILSGMPLISEDGLVGLVTATSNHAAKGMLLLDRQSAVDAVVQRSRARGVVRGAGDELVFEFVGRESDVAAGDVLITSGLGGVYPKGLRIGTITEVDAAGAQLLREARVGSAVDFGRLEQVFVMLRRGPTMDLLYVTRGGDLAEPGLEDDS
ncbi:MAG: rod shape-determining protein MreC [Myxococcota bacterium]